VGLSSAFRRFSQMRSALLLTSLLLTACATSPSGSQAPPTAQRLHVMRDDKDPNQSAICMAPNGENIFWHQDASMRDPATGEGHYTCPAPAFFVLMPRCMSGEAGWMDETLEARALRLRFGRDGSFFGDSYNGRRFCMPASPH
jgi:hypothetical protein